MYCDNEEQKRELAQRRAAELKARIEDYLRVRPLIPDGFSGWENILRRQEKIKKFFRAGDKEWYDWRWQVRSRIEDVETLTALLALPPEKVEEIRKVGEVYRWAVSPYFLSLMDPENPSCPIMRQSLPSLPELLDNEGTEDPMAEELTSPAPAITRRYPDRLTINVTNQCAMYCRHCQRRRNINKPDQITPQSHLQAALDYIREHEEIRDVLLTGGDAFMLSDEQIDWLLTELDGIEHVEIKRLGTRTLATLPMRVTDRLCSVLEKHFPVYVNTQFNHPLEITPEVEKACKKLSRAGVALGNQAVLLAGVNDDAHVMKKLNQYLLKVLIRPYYIFHAKAVKGTAHFRTRVEVGIEIMEKLRGYTSGLAIPTYIINAPGGYGKIPMLPQYLVSKDRDKVKIRTWENRILDYDNHE
ncbi:MAG: glutamate 2,3-aminomutase [Firmicutes bacterium]|jgi:lysine 2,3-aminomutase|nr:glutamate 2,3-aminomutase [Bacillota bacterium]